MSGRPEHEADIIADMFGTRTQPPSVTPVAARPVPSSCGTVQTPWRIVVTLLLAGLIGAGSIIFGLQAAEGLVASWGEPDPAAPAWVEAVYTLCVFSPILVMALIGALVMRSTGLGLGERGGRALGLGLAVGLGGFALTAAFAWLAGALDNEAVRQAGSSALLAGTFLTLLQVSAEEILLRGWVQPVLAERLPVWAAILIAAALFALLHIIGGARSPMSLLNLLLGGVVFGLLAARTGALLAPIAAHFAWNWTEMILLGLSPNPGVSGYGAIWNLDLTGPANWGGSDEGLNVSVGTTAVLIALALLLIPRRLAAR